MHKCQSRTRAHQLPDQRRRPGCGNVIFETNGNGNTTGYGYDGLNRLTSISYPTGNGVSISYTPTTKTAVRGGLTEATVYDGFARPKSITLGGVTRTFLYDPAGRKLFESYPGSGVGTTYGYDILDRVTGAVNGGDHSARSYTYGPATATVTDENGNPTTYTYRAYGDPDQRYLMSVGTAEPGTSISLARNAHDLVTAVTQGKVTRTYGYDIRDYLISVVNPETGTTTYGRDDAGNMTWRRVGRSGATTYTYDGQKRVTSASYPGAASMATYAYTYTNKLQSVINYAGIKSYQYDVNDNLTSETLNVNDPVTHSSLVFTTGYGYDGNDHLASITYPQSNHVVTYAPDVLGRPTQASGYIQSAGYWPSGQIKEIAYANGTRSTYGQNYRQWPDSFRTTLKNGDAIIYSGYYYDGVGNLDLIYDTADPTYSRLLGYDRVNRLTSAGGQWGNGTIAYDGSGNIKSQVLGDIASLYYQYDGQNRLASVSGRWSGNYQYDAYGDIVGISNGDIVYDGVPNLTCFNCNDTANAITYGYDGLNQRVSVQKGGATTYEIYGLHGKLLEELTPGQGGQTNTLVEHIYLGDKRVAQWVTQPGQIVQDY